MKRILVIGSPGSGKTTQARAIAKAHGATYLSLDDVAWATGSLQRPVRLPLEESLQKLRPCLEHEAGWVIDGCYADLAGALLDQCTGLLFLNPGLETCLQHCRDRPWEPDKFESKADQDAVLPTLLQFVQDFESRDDDYGLKRHRELFESFQGPKQELTSTADYPHPVP